jgi:hypothetical protein
MAGNYLCMEDATTPASQKQLQSVQPDLSITIILKWRSVKLPHRLWRFARTSHANSTKQSRFAILTFSLIGL